MSERRGRGLAGLSVAELGPSTEDEQGVGERILVAVRSRAARGGTRPMHGPSAALRIATAAAREVELQVPALLGVEIAAAVIAAPWLTDDRDGAATTWRAMRIAERLLPEAEVDPGRASGSWGAVAAAAAIDGSRNPHRPGTVADLAAALALESVAAAGSAGGYLALRAGHAASTAILAILLADAGFVGDPASITTLRQRLAVGPEPESVPQAGHLARAAADLLERSQR